VRSTKRYACPAAPPRARIGFAFSLRFPRKTLKPSRPVSLPVRQRTTPRVTVKDAIETAVAPPWATSSTSFPSPPAYVIVNCVPPAAKDVPSGRLANVPLTGSPLVFRMIVKTSPGVGVKPTATSSVAPPRLTTPSEVIESYSVQRVVPFSSTE
jgi:hypothetical protein